MFFYWDTVDVAVVPFLIVLVEVVAVGLVVDDEVVLTKELMALPVPDGSDEVKPVVEFIT